MEMGVKSISSTMDQNWIFCGKNNKLVILKLLKI